MAGFVLTAALAWISTYASDAKGLPGHMLEVSLLLLMSGMSS